MDINDYLPIGTAVLLKNAEIELIIIGYKAIIDTKEGKQTADYIACRYAEGVTDLSSVRFFNKESIDKVIELGYEGNEWTKFKEMLQQ